MRYIGVDTSRNEEDDQVVGIFNIIQKKNKHRCSPERRRSLLNFSEESLTVSIEKSLNKLIGGISTFPWSKSPI